MSNIKKTRKDVVFLIVLIFIGNFAGIFLVNNNDDTSQTPLSQGIVQDDYIVEWLDNPTFETPISPWYNTTVGDISDINPTTDFNQGNYEILGDSGVLQVDEVLSSLALFQRIVIKAPWFAFSLQILSNLAASSSFPAFKRAFLSASIREKVSLL